MLPLPIFKTIGLLSAPIFRFAPTLYFRFYSAYKRKTDQQKIKLIKKYVKPGDTVLDIGAHIGFYAKLFADIVGPDGKVFAFEPDPVNFERLKQNTINLPNVTARQAAVGDSDGMIKLYRSKLLNVDHRTYSAQGDKRKAVEVPLIRLDTIFREDKQRIAFIKIDIQGYEAQAFLGMKNLLEKNKPVIISELWPWGLKQSGPSVENIVSFLQGIGYNINLIEEETGKLETLNISKLNENEQDYYDVICVPK